MKVVFAGPSLHGAPVSAEGISLRPPAGNGDVLAAVLEGATVIGLIDGTFGADAAVWHKEILFALQQGVVVLGAASMGALRAAECAAFGMIPVGRIAAAYVDGLIDDDAWVVLTHAPPELDCIPLTIPMVDFEATIGALLEAGDIEASEAGTMIRAAGETFFQTRTFASVARVCFPAARAAEVAELCEKGHRSIKRMDALELITLVRKLPDARRSAPATWQFESTRVWQELLEQVESQAGLLCDFSGEHDYDRRLPHRPLG